MSPVEWAFIMMPPGLTIGFILSLLLVATMLPGGGGEGYPCKRDKERGPPAWLATLRHLDSAAMFFCQLPKQRASERKRRRRGWEKGGSDGGPGRKSWTDSKVEVPSRRVKPGLHADGNRRNEGRLRKDGETGGV